MSGESLSKCKCGGTIKVVDTRQSKDPDILKTRTHVCIDCTGRTPTVEITRERLHCLLKAHDMIATFLSTHHADGHGI